LRQNLLLLMGSRNKRSLALNLKDPRAIDIVMSLLPQVDVVAENYRPGVMEQLGLGYEALKAVKPDIIYASGSGFGPDGPYASRPGQDLIIQAMSGIAAIIGTRQDGPRAVGVSVVDHHGAALYANGILTALLNRERTGEGCRVDVSLLAAALDLQQESLTCFLNGDGSTYSIQRQWPASFGTRPKRFWCFRTYIRQASSSARKAGRA
jgi:crotonobetainyl-CoA:carnitine CoA-transferase CaiB-like acyl-CoA transferase